MKRSNIIFFSLLAVLYVTPFLILGVTALIPVDKSYTGFNGTIKVLEIENPELAPEDIKVDPTFIPKFRELTTCRENNSTYLYYKGKEQYLPEVTDHDSTLVVKGPIDGGQDKELTLHVRMNYLNKIVLNGQEIRTR